MPEWREDTRRTSSSKSTKQDKYELTKSEATNTGPTRICAKSSTIYYSCGFNILWDCSLDMNVSLIILPLWRHFPFCCDAISDFIMKVFLLFYYIVCYVYYIVLLCLSVSSWSLFLWTERKNVFNGERNLIRIGVSRGRTN